MIAQPMRDPFAPQLHCVFETERTRMDRGLLRSLRHQQADEVVRQEVDPDFLHIHLRSVAAEFGHLQCRLDCTQVDFNMSALPKQLPQLGFAHPARTQEGGDQDLHRTVPDLHGLSTAC